MSNYHFYPRLTPELVSQSGFSSTEYEFSYVLPPDNEVMPLSCTIGRVATLSDPQQMWDLQNDGLIIKKRVAFEYPDVFKGPNGVAPSRSKILPCLLWSNKRLSLAGAIKPLVESSGPSLICSYEHRFEPGELAGDLTLELVLYLAESADQCEEDERILINEAGVTLGNIEEAFSVDLDGLGMDFPIEEYEDEGGPLWRMQFEPWDDPRSDLFSEASFTLLLNVKHPACPRISRGVVTNQPLLQEIIAEAYYLLFERVRADDSAWSDLMSGTDLEPDSICSVLHWFSERDGEDRFDWSSPEGRMLSIKKIVDFSFEADDDGK